MQKSLVAFDTDHIKEYVFGTDRLKEIRGASSLLDRLNRSEMKRIARKYTIEAEVIYTNGGSGLFVVDSSRAEEFGQQVQYAYREKSEGKASVTFAVEPLPNSESVSIFDLKKRNLEQELKSLTYRLIEAKGCPAPILALPSHSFMRLCSSCGVEYAEEEYHEAGDIEVFYCKNCRVKQKEDGEIKKHIPGIVSRVLKEVNVTRDYVWNRILFDLHKEGYILSLHPKLDRPDNFNDFRRFAQSKEYIGLIYADANNMGKTVEKLNALEDRQAFALGIDKAIHKAMARAIKEHLPIVEIKSENEVGEDEKIPVFPFDVLLIGGDDIVMVTDAAKAMDVALAIAQQFYALANDEQTFGKNKRIAGLLKENVMSLSVGVVLAPIKYPFGLLQDMAESALSFAKKAAADDRAKVQDSAQFDGTRINFQVITGGSSPKFNETYNNVYYKVDKDKNLEFHASLRPYKPDDLKILLDAIRNGHELKLGRTKLHQLREAVFDKNLTTSVQKGLAVLSNWRSEKQRGHIVGKVYEFGGRYKLPRSDPRDPVSGFPRVTFPWFADVESKGRSIYRTPLLDFIELYDFLAREGGNNGDES